MVIPDQCRPVWAEHCLYTCTCTCTHNISIHSSSLFIYIRTAHLYMLVYLILNSLFILSVCTCVDIYIHVYTCIYTSFISHPVNIALDDKWNRTSVEDTPTHTPLIDSIDGSLTNMTTSDN